MHHLLISLLCWTLFCFPFQAVLHTWPCSLPRVAVSMHCTPGKKAPLTFGVWLGWVVEAPGEEMVRVDPVAVSLSFCHEHSPRWLCPSREGRSIVKPLPHIFLWIYRSYYLWLCLTRISPSPIGLPMSDLQLYMVPSLHSLLRALAKWAICSCHKASSSDLSLTGVTGHLHTPSPQIFYQSSGFYLSFMPWLKWWQPDSLVEARIKNSWTFQNS